MKKGEEKGEDGEEKVKKNGFFSFFFSFQLFVLSQM